MDEHEQRQRLPVQENEALSFCPSFNTYSSERFAEIASKVNEELSGDANYSADEASPLDTSNEFDDDDGFEFALVRTDPDVTADEIFYDRQIFPMFNRNLLIHDDRDAKPDVSSLRISLKKLFIEEREPPSSSSSEADELETIPPGTYCVWRPKVVEASPGRCKKSNSTGSESKRWKFLDLLRRSHSDGKDDFVFLTPKNKEQRADRNEKVENIKERRNSGDAVKVAGKVKAKGAAGVASAHEVFYVRNRALKEGDKKKSFLPYRQDLVGFFANVNGASRSFPSF